jgi:mobilization protein NikA
MWRPATRPFGPRLSWRMAYTERITVRVTPEQRARIATGAALAGQSISAFLRTAALEAANRVLDGRDLIATIDAHLLAPNRERPTDITRPRP